MPSIRLLVLGKTNRWYDSRSGSGEGSALISAVAPVTFSAEVSDRLSSGCFSWGKASISVAMGDDGNDGDERDCGSQADPDANDEQGKCKNCNGQARESNCGNPTYRGSSLGIHRICNCAGSRRMIALQCEKSISQKEAVAGLARGLFFSRSQQKNSLHRQGRLA